MKLCRSGNVRSGYKPWPAVLRDLSAKLFDELFVRRFFKSSTVQENGTLMSSSRVINERLCAVYTSSEEMSWPHPVECKLDTISGTDQEPKC